MQNISLKILTLILVTQSLAFGLGWYNRYSNYYTNTYENLGSITAKTNKAIDFAITNNLIDFVIASPEYKGDLSAAVGFYPGTALNNDYPIYWLDIAKSLNQRHLALGFIDLVVTVNLQDPGDAAGTGLTNGWLMNGDADNRGDNDLRSFADGQAFDTIDSNFKALAFGTAYNSTSVRYTSNTTAWNGEYVIMKFSVPDSIPTHYNLYLGKGNIQVTGAKTGTAFSTATASGLYYQVRVYTPVLTNTLIPVINISSPAVDGVYEQAFDPVANFMRNPVKHVRIPNKTPIVYSAANSFKSNITIAKYEWDVNGTGNWVAGGETFPAFYQTNGIYQVKVRLTTTAGLVVANDGLPVDSGRRPSLAFPMGVPDQSPLPFPYPVEVVDPPAQFTIQEVRPSPFIIGTVPVVYIDFNLKEDTQTTVSIFQLNGNLVKNLLSSTGKYPAGYWSLAWDGKDVKGNFVSEGIYFAVLTTPKAKGIVKIHVLRAQ